MYRLRPSAAGIWGKPGGCTAYPAMLDMVAATNPELLEDTDASSEGTAAHEVAAAMIEAISRAGSPEIPEIASNGVLITEEMIDGALIYANDVGAVMRSSGVFGGEYFNVEQPVPIPYVHEDNGGTPDMWLFTGKGGTLYVWDYKFGHRFVDAYENYQLIDYACGILTKLEINGLDDQHMEVVFRVVQPRSYGRGGPVREWRIKASDLRAYFNVLHANAHKTEGADAEFVSGDHCRDCPGRHGCDAAQKAAYNAIEYASKQPFAELDPLAMSIELGILERALKAVEYRRDGLLVQAETLARNGTAIPGWRLETKYGRKAWKTPASEVKLLGELMGVQTMQEKPITPAQAVAAGLDEQTVEQYAETPIRGVKLIEDNPGRVFKQ